MSGETNPDERFDQVESVLNQPANSQRHLLTAQVLMNDRMDRLEAAVLKMAEQIVKFGENLQALADNFQANQIRIDLKIEALVDSQKHTDSKLDALTDIVRQLIERNGSAGH